MKNEEQIKKEIVLGEDSTRQFKERLNSTQHLAEEMCAMSNSQGGVIFVGVRDDNSIAGLTNDDIKRFNPWIADAANQLIRPAIYPETQKIEVDGKILLVIYVPEGTIKPYCDNRGVYWIKSGSDKRIASPQEIARLLQQTAQINFDEIPVSGQIFTIINEKKEWNLDLSKFYSFFEKNFGREVASEGIPLENILDNMNLAKDGKLTLAGLLLFGNNVQGAKPFCLIRAIAYPGNQISDNAFNDRRDCIGTLEEQFRSAITFLKNNLSRVQTTATFNSPGVLEINELALEEAVVNALVHRDYTKNALIRLLIFKDRVEIISPGSLPNHLSIENIKSGNSIMRNPLISSYGFKILPYSGIGSGIPRILKNHPNTELVNDKDGEQFIIRLFRNKSSS